MNFFEFTQNVFKFMFFRRMYHTTDARASMPFFSFIHDLISTDCLFEKKNCGVVSYLLDPLNYYVI